MSASGTVLHKLYGAPYLMNDPGASGTIYATKQLSVCPIVTATTETRTLAQPTKAGILCTIAMDAYGGAATLTVTGGYNQAGTTSVVLGTAGDFVTFLSAKIGASYYWRLIAQEGTSATSTDVIATTVNATSSTITNANSTLSIATTMNATTSAITNATLGRMQITATTVNAAGSVITNAANLSYGRNIVLLADNTTAVILPIAVANGTVEVIQTVNAKSLNVFPQVNSDIAGLGANAVFTTGTANTAAVAGVTQNVKFTFIATNATRWYVDK